MCLLIDLLNNNYITIKAWINKKKGTLCNFSSWQVQVQELIQDVPVSVYSTGVVTGNRMKSKNEKFPLNMAIIKHILHFFTRIL